MIRYPGKRLGALGSPRRFDERNSRADNFLWANLGGLAMVLTFLNNRYRIVRDGNTVYLYLIYQSNRDYHLFRPHRIEGGQIPFNRTGNQQFFAKCADVVEPNIVIALTFSNNVDGRLDYNFHILINYDEPTSVGEKW